MKLEDQQRKVISQLSVAVAVLVLIILALVAYIAYDKLYVSQPAVCGGGVVEGAWCGTVDPMEGKRGTDSCEGRGETLFKQNCAACHMVSDKLLVGRGMSGVMDRVPSKEWFVAFVQNPDSVYGSGDAYAKVIVESSSSLMPSFTYLSQEEIECIIAYIELMDQ